MATYLRALDAGAPPNQSAYYDLQCGEGYGGVQCGRCLPGFGRRGDNVCVKCASRALNILYYILGSFVNLFFIFLVSLRVMLRRCTCRALSAGAVCCLVCMPTCYVCIPHGESLLHEPPGFAALHIFHPHASADGARPAARLAGHQPAHGAHLRRKTSYVLCIPSPTPSFFAHRRCTGSYLARW